MSVSVSVSVSVSMLVSVSELVSESVPVPVSLSVSASLSVSVFVSVSESASVFVSVSVSVSMSGSVGFVRKPAIKVAIENAMEDAGMQPSDAEVETIATSFIDTRKRIRNGLRVAKHRKTQDT